MTDDKTPADPNERSEQVKAEPEQLDLTAQQSQKKASHQNDQWAAPGRRPLFRR